VGWRGGKLEGFERVEVGGKTWGDRNLVDGKKRVVLGEKGEVKKS